VKSALFTIWSSDFVPQAALGFAFVILAAILSSIAPTLASIALVIGALITIGTLTFGFQPVRERIGPRWAYWRAMTLVKQGMAAKRWH